MAKYKPYKMKGHALPGINQQEGHPKVAAEGLAASSPLQHTRYFGQNTTIDEVNAVTSHNQAHQKEAAKEKKGAGKTDVLTKNIKDTSDLKKSPAKCPLVAALAPIAGKLIGGMMSKKKEE